MRAFLLKSIVMLSIAKHLITRVSMARKILRFTEDDNRTNAFR
jgi:hypothetical protein